MSKIRFVGLDVHAETIAVAVADQGEEVRSLGIIPNREDSIRRLVKKLGPPEQLRVCYEAGPTGYVLYWQLTQLGVKCEVVAPTLVPVKAGDRVKTDRRDAEKLARSYRAGDLTPVWVPDAAHEALRDLVRAREAAKKDQLRARHRLSKFLLRHGEAARGHEGLDAETSEVGEVGRPFRAAGAGGHAAGLRERGRPRRCPHRAPGASDRRGGEDGAGADARGDRGAAGTARDRPGLGGDDRGRSGRAFALPRTPATDGLQRHRRQRALQRRAEPARRYHQDRQCPSAPHRHRGGVGLSTPTPCRQTLRKRQEKLSEEVKEIAWKAQHRLHARYRKLSARGKNKQQVITAIGRELFGFIWAIGVKVEAEICAPKGCVV